METTQSLKRRIDSVKDLQSVVKTMKSLAAVNIRQYERAARSLKDYARTVELGLQALLREGPGTRFSIRKAPAGRVGAVVFGSDQGMCGSLNEQVVNHTVDTLNDLGVDTGDVAALPVGERVYGRLMDAGYDISDVFHVPTSVQGITPMVSEILFKIDEWHTKASVDQIYLFYCRQTSQASFRPLHVNILPVDQDWLDQLKSEEWDTNMIPFFRMDPDALFSALIREYLFISIYRAFVDSLASENASRLASMQGAEKNIDEQLGSLNMKYHQQRQMAITEELLDVVGGFVALES